jgi:hypothetical protein
MEDSMLVIDERETKWSAIMPRKTVVELQIGFLPPLLLTWEQFSDLGNCCGELAEHGADKSARFGSVAITIKQEKQ